MKEKWIILLKVIFFKFLQKLTCLVACAIMGMVSAHEPHVEKTLTIVKKIPVHIPVYKTVHVPHVRYFHLILIQSEAKKCEI